MADINAGRQKKCPMCSKKKASKIENKRLYKIYHNMKSRCLNDKLPAFKRYGGRGIVIEDDFKTFTLFEKWAIENGYNNSLTIDRINNDGNYSIGNCRWVNASVQNYNKSKRVDSTSGFFGVSWNTGDKRWRAQVVRNGEKIFIGNYKSIEEAVGNYDGYVISNKLEARINNERKV
jgi:hypothetical protein